MIVRNIKYDLKKILTGYGFYLCIIFTFILCFSSEIYEDPLNGNKYSVVTSLLEFNKDFMLNNTDFCSFEVMSHGARGWLSLFIPIIAAFVYVPLFCDEYQSKSVRFMIFRSSKFSYYISRYISACIGGGAAVLIGFSLYTMSVYMLFPNISEYSNSLRSIYEQEVSDLYLNITEGSYRSAIVSKHIEMFVYGTVNVVPALVLSSFCYNKYVIMCIPFFLKYAVNQSCLRIQAEIINQERPNIFVLKLNSVFNPDALTYLSQFGESKRYVIFYNSGIILCFCLLYLLFINRRCDCGE